jgi:REP element-mobilizing transposase RayT
LEFLTVDADYFQWGLRVVPSTQTSQFMQVIRQNASEMILSAFEHIRNENSGNDFWTPGHLVVLGSRARPEQMIKQYIRMSRRQQKFLPVRSLESASGSDEFRLSTGQPDQ